MLKLIFRVFSNLTGSVIPTIFPVFKNWLLLLYVAAFQVHWLWLMLEHYKMRIKMLTEEKCWQFYHSSGVRTSKLLWKVINLQNSRLTPLVRNTCWMESIQVFTLIKNPRVLRDFLLILTWSLEKLVYGLLRVVSVHLFLICHVVF